MEQAGRLAPRAQNVNQSAVAEDRLILAIGRLERSLSRLERAAAAREAAADGSAMREIVARHEGLKHRVEGAIAALDGLIARG